MQPTRPNLSLLAQHSPSSSTWGSACSYGSSLRLLLASRLTRSPQTVRFQFVPAFVLAGCLQLVLDLQALDHIWPCLGLGLLLVGYDTISAFYGSTTPWFGCPGFDSLFQSLPLYLASLCLAALPSSVHKSLASSADSDIPTSSNVPR